MAHRWHRWRRLCACHLWAFRAAYGNCARPDRRHQPSKIALGPSKIARHFRSTGRQHTSRRKRADVRHASMSLTILLDHSSFRDSRFGQAFIDAVVGIAQSGVIEPELVQDGRHQIGNTHPIRHGAIAKLIGRAVDISASNPPPASRAVKPCGLWSRPVPPCEIGMRPNSPTHKTIVLSSNPRCFRSPDQRRGGTDPTCARRFGRFF